MKIVLEGCDRAGKTTLARRLSEELGMPVFSFGPPKGGDAFSEYCAFLDSYPGDAILDRFHVGEFVYSIVYDRRCSMTRTQFRQVEAALLNGAAEIVYVTAIPDALKARFYNEPLNKAEDVGLTLDLYSVYFKRLCTMGIPTVYDTTYFAEADAAAGRISAKLARRLR